MAVLEDSICMLCAEDSAHTHLGTAWVCGPGLAMTAWHVVDSVDALELVCDAGKAAAWYLDHSAEYDVALLRFEEMELDLPALPMNDDGDWHQGDAWHSWGHPIGYPAGFPLDGEVSSPGARAAGIRRLVLKCEQGPKPCIHGMSGGPVLDAQGAVIGVLTDYPQDIAQVTLFATRLDDAWAQLRRWRRRAPADWPSAGAVSRYFALQNVEWDRPTHRVPFLRRATPRLSDIFVAPRFRAPHNPQRSAAPAPQGMLGADTLLDLLYEDTRHLVLRGDPGTGKSVLLRWLASLAARHWRTRHARRLVPVIVHAAKLAAADCGTVLHAALADDALWLPPGAAWLLMVDGLDEVVDVEDRRRIVDRLRIGGPSPAAFRGSPVRLAIASRPLAVLDEFPPSQARHVVLQPFTGVQLESFATRWFADQAPQRLAQDFMDEVRLSRLEGLAAIPALATMAAVVFERSANHTLPRRRSDLYDRFTELMLQEREDKAWQGFVGLCVALDRACDGEALARLLWGKRREYATLLAVQIQDGTTELGADDFVQPLVRIAQNDGVLPMVPEDSLQADGQWKVMNDLMLGCGLFIGGTAGRLEFFHNTIREALAAQAVIADTPPRAAAMWLVVRRWSEPRWREIVLLALSRWSRQDETAQREIWTLLAPLMESSHRALQFVGMAVAEGMELPAENEAQVMAALFDRLGAWNPCADVFLEFSSPNPLGVLRLLTRRERFVQMLVKEFDENPKKCSFRMWAFLEFTLDQAGSKALRRYLDAEPDVALAAATLLARAGEADLAAPRMIDALRDKENGERKQDAVSEWRVAEVIAEYGSAAHLRAVLDAGDIAPDTCLAAAAAGWRRYRDAALAARAAQLLGFCAFDARREEDVALLRRVLAVPGVAQDRPLASSLAAVLAALCAPAEASRPSPAWVHALCSAADEPAALRGLAHAAVLFAEPDPALDTDALLALLQDESLDVAVLAALAGGLACARRLDVLECISAATPLRLAARFAAALAWLAADGGEAPRARIGQLLVQLRGTPQWDNCVSRLGESGQVDLAADECMHALTLPSAQGGMSEIRKLMDMGCTGHIAQLVHTQDINPMVLQFAVRCLGQLGDAPRLGKVACDTAVRMPVRLHAVKELAELGWVQEAADQAQAIAQEIGEPAERTVEQLEGFALAEEVASGPWPPAVLVEMAGAAKEFFPVWSSSLVKVLERPGLSSEDAVSVMNALGNAHAPLDLVLQHCRAQPGDGGPLRTLAVFAREEENFAIALRALGTLCGYEDDDEEGGGDAQAAAAWALRRCAVLVALVPDGGEERVHMLQWVSDQAGKIWVGVLAGGALGGQALLRSLEDLIATGHELYAAGRMLRHAALLQAGAQQATAALWAFMVPCALALERSGNPSGAAALARVPFERNVAFDPDDADCVALALLLSRCKSTRLVQNDLRRFALHAALPLAQRAEAATALAKNVGGKDNEELLGELQRLLPS